MTPRGRWTWRRLLAATLMAAAASCGGGDAAIVEPAVDATGGDTPGDIAPDVGAEDAPRVPDATLDGAPSDGATTEAATTDALVADAGLSRTVHVDDLVRLDGSASVGAVMWQWSFGDGRPPGAPSASPAAEVSYSAPGRYHAVLTVFDAAGRAATDAVTITVVWPPVDVAPQSGSIARFGPRSAAVVAEDSQEVSIIEWSEDGDFAVSSRHDVGCGPVTVTPLAAGGFVTVCADTGSVTAFDAAESPTATVLGADKRAYAAAEADGKLWVTLQAVGALMELEWTPEGFRAGAMHPVIEDARGVTRLPDGRLAVTRWRSPDGGGHIAIFDPVTHDIVSWQLAVDPQGSSDTEIGGVPTWLEALAISPDGRRLAVPAMHANLADGRFRNGIALRHDTAVRAIVATLQLPDGTEQLLRRKQIDNRGLASAAVYNGDGDYLFVATRGSRSVERLDTFTGAEAGSILDVGYAPRGLALSADDRWLLVDAHLSREVVVYDVRSFDRMPVPHARLATVSAEPLAADVLRGKQLFNDSFDRRLTRDGYLACAHCHLDGDGDGRVWDFGDRGEGLRNTISLLGRAGGDGPLHWSGNFDEVQDFEHDIRGAFAGAGLMADDDFHAAGRDTPLGAPKAGVSADLDALAAYVASLDEHLPSPHRGGPGETPPAAARGRAIFESAEAGCTTCHAGPRFTDSAFDAPGAPRLHDVGTLRATSGERLGGPLSGIDTPTLRGLWHSAPYLHDGSAATLRAVLVERNTQDRHGATSHLSDADVDDLIAYLLILDDTSN